MTGAELKKLRKSTGLTQERFAVLVIGVTGATICRWERKVHPIDDLSTNGIEARVARYIDEQRK